MCKSVVNCFALVLFFCIAAISAPRPDKNKKFTLLVDGFDNEYLFSFEVANWQLARTRCRAKGAELLVPGVEEEALAVSWLKTWTGINDLDNTGAYRIPDGRPLGKVHPKWGENQPDSNNGEWRCVYMHESLLNVATCNMELPYMCKFPAPTAPPPSQCDDANELCDRNFTAFNTRHGTDYKYEFHREYVTWHQARERCAGAGAQLLVPEDEGEAKGVRGEDRAFPCVSVWTGINDLKKTGDFRTPDDQPINSVYHAWAPSDPNQRESNCVVMRPDSLLHVRHCGWTYPYVCQFNPPPPQPIYGTTPPCQADGICQRSFTIQNHGEDIKYEFHPELVTWHQARDRCAGAGAQLWVPEDGGEARAVRGEDRLYPHVAVWLGINDLDKGGVYRTVDGRPLSAVHHGWHDGRPDLEGVAWHCVMLLPDSSLLARYCGWTGPYVCKFPPESANAASTKPVNKISRCDDANELCDNTFKIKINGTKIKYVFHHEYVTWHQAKERCAGAGAQLLVPEDEEETRTVRGEDRTFPNVSIWVGIDDLFKRGDLRTSDGRPLSAVYDKWEAGTREIRNISTKHMNTLRKFDAMRTPGRHCMLLLPDSLLRISFCGWTYPYVCKFYTPPLQPYCKGDLDSCNRTFTAKINGTDINYIYHYDLATWHQARERCAGAGARLWTPGDAAEAQAVAEGLNRFLSGFEIWTGFNDLNKGGVYRALDGRPLSEVHLEWHKGRPDVDGVAWHCVTMLPDTSLNVSYCGSTSNYVCEIPLHSNDRKEIVQIEDEITLEADNGAKILYEYNEERVSWHEARRRCSAAGAQLWAPGDVAEAQEVREGVNRAHSFWTLWTGLNNLNSSGGLHYSLDGQPVTSLYNKWSPAEPFSGGLRHCVMILPDSKLYAAGCDWNAPYVCKYPAAPAAAAS